MSPAISILARRTVSAIASAALLAPVACSAPAPEPASDASTTVLPAETQPGEHVDAATFASLIDAGATVIDVRTAEEFSSGHLPGAFNIDVTAPDFTEQLAALDEATSYAVYCRSGNRSQTAIELMAEAGLTDVTGLRGGIGAWDGPLQK